MIDWNNAEITCSEFVKPRAIHEIEAELIRMISPEFHPQIWKLIEEIKDSAWESGVEEANAWQEAFKQDHTLTNRRAKNESDRLY